MKKLLLLASCLLLSDACKGCQKPEKLSNRYVKTAVAQQGIIHGYYNLREAELDYFMPIDGCPVPSTPPSNSPVDGCPVPSTPPVGK